MWNKGFNRSGFMKYLKDNFNGFAGVNGHYLRELAGNVIDYGLKWERVGKDQFCDWLTEMFPDVEFGEVAQFISDGSLTEQGQKKKYDWAESHGIDNPEKEMREIAQGLAAYDRREYPEEWRVYADRWNAILRKDYELGCYIQEEYGLI